MPAGPQGPELCPNSTVLRPDARGNAVVHGSPDWQQRIAQAQHARQAVSCICTSSAPAQCAASRRAQLCCCCCLHRGDLPPPTWPAFAGPRSPASHARVWASAVLQGRVPSEGTPHTTARPCLTSGAPRCCCAARMRSSCRRCSRCSTPPAPSLRPWAWLAAPPEASSAPPPSASCNGTPPRGQFPAHPLVWCGSALAILPRFMTRSSLLCWALLGTRRPCGPAANRAATQQMCSPGRPETAPGCIGSWPCQTETAGWPPASGASGRLQALDSTGSPSDDKAPTTEASHFSTQWPGSWHESSSCSPAGAGWAMPPAKQHHQLGLVDT